MRWIHDDRGYTTVAAMVAVFVVVCLVSLSLQVYWVNSAAGDVQTVADAAALAGANAMSKVIMTYEVCDAIILAFNLTIVVTIFFQVVVGLIPGGQGFATVLESAITAMKEIRTTLQNAMDSLLRFLVKASPYLSILNAEGVIAANGAALRSAGRPGGYYGICIPIPLTAALPPRPDGDAITGGDGQLDKEDQAAKAKQQDMRSFEEQKAALLKKIDQLHADILKIRKEMAKLDPKNRADPSYANLVSAYQSMLNAEIQGVQDAFPSTRLEPTGQDMVLLRERWKSSTVGAATEIKKLMAQVSDGTDADAKLVRVASSTLLQRKVDIAEPDLLLLQAGKAGAYLTPAPPSTLPARSATLLRIEQDYRTGLPFPNIGPGYQVFARPFTLLYAKDVCLSWNDVVKLFNKIQAIERQITALKKQLEALQNKEDTTVKKGFVDKLKEAVQKLKEIVSPGGERAIYQFPGSDGFIAIVVATETRQAPDWTMAKLIPGGSVQPRLAVAGAQLGNSSDTVLSNLFKAGASGGGGPLGFLGQALAGGGDLIMTFIDKALAFYADGLDAIKGALESVIGWLPLPGIWKSNLVSWITGAFDSVLASGGLAPPVTATPKPVLVNTYVALKSSTAYAAVKGGYDSYVKNDALDKTALRNAAINALSDEVGQRTTQGLETLTKLEVTFSAGGVKFTIPVTLPKAITEGAGTAVKNRASDFFNSALPQWN